MTPLPSPQPTLVGPLLQAFFSEHLCLHKRVSLQTIASYRDSFRLLLQFLHTKTATTPTRLRILDLDASAILGFLEHLEQTRGNSIRSRNARLTAIRSFFRFVALRDPASVVIATRVLAIPVKRTDKRLVGFLSRPEMDAVLAAPDRSQWLGRRNHALLLTLYNTGARVSEIAGLKRAQIQFGNRTFLELHGKGRKERTVPLWPHTAKVLRAWIQEQDSRPSTPVLFPSFRGHPLTRDSVHHLLRQAVQAATSKCPSLTAKRVSPHVIRHSTACHLLQAGVDIAVVALWLGHEHVQTTYLYLQADLTNKEQALAKLSPAGQSVPRFRPKDNLLAFLANL
jgi:integrase/recombinase XerD